MRSRLTARFNSSPPPPASLPWHAHRHGNAKGVSKVGGHLVNRLVRRAGGHLASLLRTAEQGPQADLRPGLEAGRVGQ